MKVKNEINPRLKTYLNDCAGPLMDAQDFCNRNIKYEEDFMYMQSILLDLGCYSNLEIFKNQIFEDAVKKNNGGERSKKCQKEREEELRNLVKEFIAVKNGEIL